MSLVVPPIVRLVELLRLRPEVGLTFLSSGGAVYGNVDTPPAAESTPADPISSYGILKLTVEMYLTAYARLYGVPVRILRVSNAFGPGQLWAKGQGIVPRLLHCAVTGERFSVYGDGCDIRDYVYIDDVAGAVLAMVSSDLPFALFNVGSGAGHSVLDVVRVVEGVSGHRIGIEHLPHRPFDVRNIVLDIRRIQAHMDYHPVAFRDGVQRTWQSRFNTAGGGLVPAPALQVPKAAR